MKDEDKPLCAVLVRDFVQYSKWLKYAARKSEMVYRPVFSMNSAIGIGFDAMIVTRDFWKTNDAKQVYSCVKAGIARKLKERQGVDASNGILKKRSTRFLERAFGILWR